MAELVDEVSGSTEENAVKNGKQSTKRPTKIDGLDLPKAPPATKRAIKTGVRAGIIPCVMPVPYIRYIGR